MVMRVERIGERYGVLLTDEAMETLRLTEGAAVEIRPVEEQREIVYASVEAATESYLRTEPLHAQTYRELAK